MRCSHVPHPWVWQEGGGILGPVLPLGNEPLEEAVSSQTPLSSSFPKQRSGKRAQI